MERDVTRTEFEDLRKFVKSTDKSSGCAFGIIIVLAALIAGVAMNAIDARLSALEAAQAAKEEAR